MNLVRTIFACVLALLTGSAGAASVLDFVRIRGQGESVLQGIGLVVGLNGTGDGGKEMATIRPLAELLRRNEMPVASLAELGNSKSAALVMVTCVIPREGAKPDDTFDARVSVINSATSLKGGELYIAPLTEPRPGGRVFGFAQGVITIEDEKNPTTGVIARGVRMVRGIQTTPPIEGVFELILENWYAGWTSAHYIASQINDTYHLDTNPSVERIARVIDERTIRVTVPPEEKETSAAFISDVMQTLVDPKQFGLPAMVIANTKTGSIVVTGNVQISPAVITRDDMVLTTTLPPPVPTPQQPLVQTDRWAPVGTATSRNEMARLDDLLAAFKRLEVDPSKQIQMLRDLHRSGSLHAKLIIDGSEG